MLRRKGTELIAISTKCTWRFEGRWLGDAAPATSTTTPGGPARRLLEGKLLLILCAAASLVLVGCSTPQKSTAREDFRSVSQKYQIQAYDECLKEITKLMKKRLAPGAKAQLNMAKGLCLEEKGDPAAADEIYRKVVADFPQSRFADGARRRLERRDGDQKERVEIVFNDEHWQRLRKHTSPAGVRVAYYRFGEDLQRSGAMLDVLSIDRPAEVKTLEDALARCESEFVLKGGRVETTLLERTENDAIWEFVLTANQRAPMAGLLRIVLTPQRMHGILGRPRTRTMSADAKREWVERLKRATVVGSK